MRTCITFIVSKICKTTNTTFQRIQLEDDFDDLIKTASSDIKDAFKSEIEKTVAMETNVDIDDENLVLDEYNSDDGDCDKNSDDEDDDNDDVHCTKVGIAVMKLL